jgi:UDPglucose 6-dehydrogenase/GDP-mannose 6-dehydrogenase
LISFSNEIAALCEHLPDTDIDTVMGGLHLDRRLSPLINGVRLRPGVLEYLRAGIGFGGSCLPKDVNALRAFARERQVDTPMLDATVRINTARPLRIVDRVGELLAGLQGRTVALLGLAFKPGTDDVRDSPSLPLLRALQERGADVRAYDPLSLESSRRALGDANPVVLCTTPEDALAGADAVLIATAWPEFAEWDWARLAGLMRRAVIVDGRNALRHVRLPADILYQPIGQKAPRTAQDGARKAAVETSA